MDMHQVGRRADWASVAEADLTFWQRLAARSAGVVTPGNITSVLGLILVLIGLCMLLRGQTLASFLLVGFGRLADLLDGIVAHKTGTKSPIGEAVDAGIDKIELLVAVVVMVALEAAPALLLGAVIVLNVAIAFVSGLSKLKQRHIHPVRTGKMATFVLWAGLGLYIGYAASRWHALATLASGFMIVASIMTCVAFIKYVMHYRRGGAVDQPEGASDSLV
jgi:phosphatidylglycerophosphate synthase